MITAAQYSAYGKAVDNLSDSARAQVKKIVAEWVAKNPDASFSDCRGFMSQAMRGVIGAYGDAASALAAQWYDKTMGDAGAKLPEAVTVTALSDEALEADAKALAALYRQGKTERFVDLAARIADNKVRKSLNETVMTNAKRDRKKGVRFARVTSGSETCTFCMMLASRGAVYYSRKSAGEFDHWHDNCHCKIVAGYEIDPMATLVEGHSPKEAGDLYASFSEIDGDKSLTGAQRESAKRTLLDGGDMDEAYEAAYGMPRRSAGRPRKAAASAASAVIGVSAEFETVRLTEREYAAVTSAINANYQARFKNGKIKSIIVDMDDGPYVYTFENNGFDDYRFLERRKLDE